MSLNRPIKILFHCEFAASTGYGGVSKNLADKLYAMKTEWGTPLFEVMVMALGSGLDPINPTNVQGNLPYKVIPQYGNRQVAPFGQDYARDIIQRTKPDIILTYGDTWQIEFWNDKNIIPEDLRRTFKLVAYVAIDGYPIPKFWIDRYKDFDKIITFTKFSKDAIDERAKEMGRKLDTSYIYHGVNPQIFKPLPQSQINEFKAQHGLSDQTKIIGMFSRNQPRKHHPEFIEFAVELLKATNNDPNIKFYFHTVNNDAGWDLDRLIEDIDNLQLRERFLTLGSICPGQEIPKEKKFDLKGRFIFPGITNPAQGYPIEMLNLMYNICDVHTLMTSGEGFGCTLSEGLAAGIPTFTNDYAAGAELIKDSGGGEVIKARDFTYRGSDHNFLRPHTDYKDAVAKVLPVLMDPALRKKYARNARAWALGNSWEIISLDWQVQLESLFKVNIDSPLRTELV